jgi:hypothetical protein
VVQTGRSDSRRDAYLSVKASQCPISNNWCQTWRNFSLFNMQRLDSKIEMIPDVFCDLSLNFAFKNIKLILITRGGTFSLSWTRVPDLPSIFSYNIALGSLFLSCTSKNICGEANR